MEQLQANFDELNLGNEKNIKKDIEKSGEKLLLSCSLFKFNDYKKRQERNILITNKHFFNLKGTNIKRKIPLNKIKGITVGIYGSEFVLHIPDEYDYRFSSPERRDRILQVITATIVAESGSKVPFYQKEDVCLVNYASTKSDKKKNVNRMPVEGARLMDGDDVRNQIEGKNRENDDMIRRTSTLWTKEKGKEVTLDDFNILKVLGAGAFGTVLLVEEKCTKAWYAMKVIKKDVIVKKGQFEHTKTEKMILEHVNHPFLVSLVYAFQDPTKLFFVMQFMKGGELFQHLRVARKFDEKRARFYTCQLALALGHLHSKDIVYRDLKLENILMDEIGNVYLTDFGMAKIIKSDELAMTFCGTPEYLSPEVIRGQGCDKTTDWWSLGILTYEMMFGLPPFYNKNQTVMFKLIKDGELKFPEKPDVSAEAKDFIIQTLNRDKSQRLGNKNDVDDILRHPWFKDIDMKLMIQKKIPPTFVPKIADDAWIDNFDKDFTQMKPRIQESEVGGYEAEKDPFKDF